MRIIIILFTTFYLFSSYEFIYPITFTLYKNESDYIKSRAEDIYANALDDYYNGDYNNAIDKLKLLVDNGITDKYIFKILIDSYLNEINDTKVLNDSKKRKKIFDELKFYVQQGIKNYPDYKDFYYTYTDIMREEGDEEGFLDSLYNILKIDTYDVFANYFLGSYYVMKKEYDEAEGYLLNVVASASYEKEFERMALYKSLYYLGYISVSKMEYGRALTYYQKSREIFPKDFEVIKNIFLIYADLLDFENAIKIYEDMLEFPIPIEITELYTGILFIIDDPKLKNYISIYKSKSYFIKAIDYYLKGKYNDSLKELENHLLLKDSKDYYSYYLYFLNYKKLKNDRKLYEYAFLLGKRAREIGKYKISVEFFKILENNKNSIPDIYWLIGSLYDDLDDYKTAINYYEKYVNYKDIDKDYQKIAKLRLSYLYSKIGNYKKSVDYINSIKNNSLTSNELFQVYYYSGLVLLERRDYSNSVNEFVEALKYNSSELNLYYYISVCFNELKNRSKAIEYLKIARNYDKNNKEINNLLAYLYALENTSLDEALKLVNLALLFDPTNVAYLDTKAWIYFMDGDYEKSYSIFMEILKLIGGEMYKEGYEEIYYHLGLLYEKLNKEEEAKKYFEISYKINPNTEYIKEKYK